MRRWSPSQAERGHERTDGAEADELCVCVHRDWSDIIIIIIAQQQQEQHWPGEE